MQSCPKCQSICCYKSDPFTWYCPTCGNGGDQYDLTEDRYEELSKQITDEEVERCFYQRNETLEEYVEGCQTELAKSEFGKEYLISRGVTQSQIKRYKIGYGLPGSRYDGMIVFPIWNFVGVLVGVSSRRIDNSPGGKYINSSTSDTFQKHWLFFGQLNKLAGEVVLVEGQFDVLSVERAGYPALAVMGGAFSEAHDTILKACGVKRIISMMDGDTAGHAYTERIKQISTLQVVDKTCTPGLDPGAMTSEQIQEHLTV